MGRGMFDLTWKINISFFALKLTRKKRQLEPNEPGELEPASDSKREADQHGGRNAGLAGHPLLHPVLQDCSKCTRFHSQPTFPLLLRELVSVRKHCIGVGNAQLKAQGGVVPLSVPNLKG